MDAGVRATKGEEEVEAVAGEEVGEGEEEPAFLYGWSEMKQEGEKKRWMGGEEEELMEEEEPMWEVEVVGMEMLLLLVVVVVEELPEDQG